jgi:hypothetical protein
MIEHIDYYDIVLKRSGLQMPGELAMEYLESQSRSGLFLIGFLHIERQNSNSVFLRRVKAVAMILAEATFSFSYCLSFSVALVVGHNAIFALQGPCFLLKLSHLL